MKINGWWIDGFGIFHDYAVRELGDGLTIFYGPNEAGKSTLLAFVRGVLFGFPDGRSAEARYPPLRGGRHGGRLLVSAAGGDWVVDRQVGRRPSVRITRPDDQAGEETDLRQLVGGADDRLFRMVFAFSLGELQSFDTLSAEGIRERIFSAGIAGAARPAREAIRELDARASILLKSRGQGRVNLLIAELAALKDRIDVARLASTGFEALVAEEERRAEEVECLGREIDVLRRQKARASLLLDLSPLWDKLQTSQAELDAITGVDDFPPDAEPRLSALLQDLRTSSTALAQLTDARQASERRRAELTTDDRINAVAGDVEDLFEGLSLHRNLLQQLSAVTARLTQTSATVDEKLRVFGPPWNEARVEAFDRSIPRQDEVRSQDGRLNRVAAAVDRASQAQSLAERRRDELEQARDRLKVPEPDEAPTEEALGLLMKTLRRLRTGVGELRAVELERATQDAIVRERERSIRMIEAELQPDGQTWIAGVPLIVTLVAVAATVWLARIGDITWVVLLSASIVTAGISFYLWHRQYSASLARAKRAPDLAAVTADLNAAVALRDQHRRRGVQIARTIAADAAALGLEAPPALQRIDEREADLLRQHSERQALEDRKERRARAEEAVELAQSEVDRAAAVHAEALANEADLRMDWQRWKARSALPDALSPQGVLDFFEAVRLTQDALQARKTARVEVDERTQRIAAWESRARTVLAAAGVSPDSQSERLVDQVLLLRRRATEDREARQALATLDAELGDRSARITALETELAAIAADRDLLFAEAGVADEPTFRRRGEAFARREALRRQVQDLEQQITARAGQDEEVVRAELATARLDEWREVVAAIAAIDPQIDAMHRRRDEAVARHRDAERERVAVESSADVPRLEIEFEGLLTELRNVVRDWQVTSLASALLEDTLHLFEHTRQPEVLATASTTFAYITKGRYTRVVQEEENKAVVVIDRDGGRRPADALSRGTAEQLYLCIRFALAAEFGRRSEPLPIVMDDVFVNFDVERAESMAYVVAEFAQNHQVLLFTCHPSTRDMLQRIVPGAGVVELTPVEPAGTRSHVRPVRPPVEPETAPAEPEPAAPPAWDSANLDLLEGIPPLEE